MCFISYAKFPGENKHNFNQGEQANAAKKWYHKERKKKKKWYHCRALPGSPV